MSRARPLLVVVTAWALALTSACGGAADLQADLHGPSVAISREDHWRELRFLAAAKTSAPLAGGEVRVHTQAPLTAEGQVRVLLAQHALEADTGRGEGVLPLEQGAEALVSRTAFESCSGACEQPFTVVFSAEAIPAGVTAELPIRIEATLLYEGEAPTGDSVALSLLE